MPRWFFSWYDAYRREIDLAILWPSCKKAAEEAGVEALRERFGPDATVLDGAKGAFAVHCFNDRPWQRLGERRIYEIIDELT